ncbi:unnamed protein product [Medioppia subpectinata]|uniref:Uncharacterized protein n=1 Tax=Medioppia subpectinata TaxID=1979941 RepID=A0A7R9LM70_9ACAR|nr:unnamed protein product [Medioppia subpectinata]CAG2119479.1 unnamed protein product [Medioppia subpectinata]
MSGQSRKDMKSGKSFDRTHLIESRTDTNNYRCAVIYGIPILFKEWIEELWQHRNDSHFDPNDINLINKFKIKAFHGLGLAFVGFSKEEPLEVNEREEMEILTKTFDGQVVDPYSNSCTHIILNANKGEKVDINFDQYERIPDNVVYKSWFTESVHIKNREEEEFHHYFSQKMRELCRTPSTCGKSSVNGLGVLSPDYDLSFSLDSSVSKSKLDTDVKALDQKSKSHTYHVCYELCQNETNYVKILKDILSIFREPLINHSEPQMPQPLLPNDIELKTIFGCLPPLIEVHEQIHKKLENIIQNWSEDNEIGKVFVEHSQQFLTAYPQYINYHEKTKEMIDECIKKYPKFESFLKTRDVDDKL